MQLVSCSCKNCSAEVEADSRQQPLTWSMQQVGLHRTDIQVFDELSQKERPNKTTTKQHTGTGAEQYDAH